MKHTIDTGLDLPSSKRAIDHAMAAYKERFADYQPRFAWASAERGEFGFNAKGVSLGGTLLVREGKIDVDMEVPFLFRVFQGKAMQVIEEQVQLWVGKVKRGEV